MKKIFVLFSFLMVGCAVVCDEKDVGEHISLGQYRDAYKKIEACDEDEMNGRSLAIKASLIAYWRQGDFQEEERLLESTRLFRLSAAKGSPEAVNALISIYRSNDEKIRNEKIADCLAASFLEVGKNPNIDQVHKCLAINAQ